MAGRRKKKTKTDLDPDSKVRICLGPDCGREFQSAHKFNRLCPKCKASAKVADWGSWGGEVVMDDLE